MFLTVPDINLEKENALAGISIFPSLGYTDGHGCRQPKMPLVLPTTELAGAWPAGHRGTALAVR